MYIYNGFVGLSGVFVLSYCYPTGILLLSYGNGTSVSGKQVGAVGVRCRIGVCQKRCKGTNYF